MAHTLFIVSHTHWDREWYLPFQEFRIRLVKLIDKLLDILAKDAGYRHFTLDGQTIILEDYLAIRPERRKELERYVREGRLLIGPWYVLADEFLVSPEALIRNLMLGHRLAEEFGAVMKVGYIPDSFGHISQLPQILQGLASRRPYCSVVWQTKTRSCPGRPRTAAKCCFSICGMGTTTPLTCPSPTTRRS